MSFESPMLEDSKEQTQGRYIAAAQVGAWLSMGILNIVVTWLALPMSGADVRLMLHLYDVGQLLAVGLAAAIIVVAWRRFGPQRAVVGYAMLAFLSIAISQFVLRNDLRGAASILGLSSWQLWASIFAALFSLCIPVAAWLSHRLSGTKLRGVVAAIAVAIAIGHQFVLPNLYLGIHTYGTWFAATLLAGSIVEPLEPLVDAMSEQTRFVKVAAAVTGVVVAGALFVPAPTAVQTQIRMLPGAVVARYKPTLRFGVAGLVPEDKIEWFEDRSTHTDIAPSAIRLVPNDAIVILLVVDAMRADMLSGEYAEQLPRMTALMREAVTFAHAYSPAPSTSATIAALFAGRYPAQIKWKLKVVDAKPRLYPDDPSLRFGDVLAKQDVESVVVINGSTMKGMRPQYGVAAGLRTEVPARNQFSKSVVTAWLEWIASHRDGPSFAYLHVLDPHAPYNLGGKSGSARERYAREVALVDQALGMLLDGLRAQELEDRAIVMLTADHGEAFGEHNSRRHGSTVYEELVHVPLVIAGKNLKSRVVSQAVTLLDLGPTVLDLFGAPTPGPFMGQSLVPLLAGQNVTLTRPIFLDSHTGYAGMVFDDGLKLVVHNGVPELYDLLTDPGELVNVYDSRDDAAKRFGTLKSFGQVHRMKFERQGR
jgi:hypothetical protein